TRRHEEGGMRGRHQGDLEWRFRVSEEQMRSVPSGLLVLATICERGGPGGSSGRGDPCVTDLHLAARERAGRIDRVLARLPMKPIDLARVLYHRYGPEEHRPALRKVMPFMSGVASMTDAAKHSYQRCGGQPPRPRSHDIVNWLEGVCQRISVGNARTEEKGAF